MKSNTRKVLLGAATVAAIGASAQEVNAAKTNLKMKAIIIQPISITQTQSMNFGSLTVAAGTSGTITLDATTSKRAAGGAGGVSLVGGTGAQEGQFKIKAAKNINIDITLPTKDTVSNGATTLKVDNFTISGAAASSAVPFVAKLTAATLKSDFKVGGRLTVTAGAGTGTYNGSVVVTALYQ